MTDALRNASNAMDEAREAWIAAGEAEDKARAIAEGQRKGGAPGLIVEASWARYHAAGKVSDATWAALRVAREARDALRDA